MNNKQCYIVDKEVLPEVFLKVMDVKNLLATNEGMAVQEAVEKVGISRSSFYKYKDAIKPFYEKEIGDTITLLIELRDEVGRLSELLSYITQNKVNILTMNQMVPVDGIACLNLRIQMNQMVVCRETLIEGIECMEGVERVKILTRE